jgi:RNA polymerase sigma factor (sigma-70 family)
LQILSEVPDLEEEESEYSADNEKIVEKVVNELGEPCHSLLVLKFWKELSGEEIAAELGYKSADSVKNQRHRCMEKLREGLKNKLICN